MGAPDLIIEVMFPSSATRDLSEKMWLYQREGVSEYWVVIPDETRILRHNLNAGRYDVDAFSAGEMRSIVLTDYSIDLALLFPQKNEQD